MQYFYYVVRGEATLNKGDDNPLKKIGKFKTDAEAIEACNKHHEKACKALSNFGLDLPEKIFL
jgi:hypothetical protein